MEKIGNKFQTQLLATMEEFNLNGKTFDEISQIPNKPHPNCRCWIEDKNKSSKDDRKKLKDIMQNIRLDVNSLKDEIFAINNNISSSNFAPSQKKIIRKI